MTAAGRAQVAAEATEKLLSAAKSQPDVSGFLVGFRTSNGVVVASCCTFCAEEATIGLADWAKELASLQNAIPCGMSAVGVFCAANLEAKLASALAAVQKQLKTSAALVAACVDEALEGVKWSMLADGGALAALDETTTMPAKDLLADRITVRLTSKVRLSAGSTAEASAKLMAENAAFCVMNNGVVAEVVSLPKDAEMTCGDLSSASSSAAEPSAPAAKKGGKKGGGKEEPVAEKKGTGGGEVVQLQQMWSLSCEGQPTTISVLGIFSTDTSLPDALSALRSGASQQLAALAALLQSSPASSPTPLHFMVTPHHPFPVTACLAIPPGELDAEESKLVEARRRLHRQLLLPSDRPFLRTPQALSFAAQLSAGIQRLINVHEGLPPSGVKGGSVHCVQGRYEYCHYMQDKFNDDGWGCMYRSYQTVLSWFRLQHYTNKPIQSHEDIQRMLVKMGDKPDRFIGSKQWIGAMEASMLLDQHLSVQSKVMNVASGHDLEDKGRELAHHFDTQGTPIPIGGGVLAFTILGVDFNAETGQVKFLILDPHYTGSEDLSTIQNQGKKNACSQIPSVGWHDVTIFRKDSFYNLCLPQRPTAI